MRLPCRQHSSEVMRQHQGLWMEMVTHGVTVRSTDARSWASQVHWGLPASAQGISRHAWSPLTARMMLG